MFDLEKEINVLKCMLDAGEIDEITYNKQVDELRRKDLIRKKYKKRDVSELIKNFCKIFIFLIFCILVICIYKNNNVTKNVEYQSSSNISKPIQKKTSGGTTKIINGNNVEINYVAEYTISGRVVNVRNYYGYDIIDKLSPRDVGLSWGFLAKDKNHKKLNWYSAKSRFLTWSCSDGEWIKEIGGKNKIQECHSNNHLIPSDNKIEKLIYSIKEGDFIRIEGYLVNVYCEKSDRSYFKWNTSTSRKDSGNGACEIIYVTNITWLEKD